MATTRSVSMSIRVNSEIKAPINQIYSKRRPSFELTALQLTENGYTPEFESELIAESERCYAAVANGTAKLYKTSAEMFADLDAEDDE